MSWLVHLRSAKLVISTRMQLWLKYRCAYVQILVTSPFLHYITLTSGNRNAHGYDTALRCVEAAVALVQTAHRLVKHGMFNKTCAVTLHGMVFSSIVLVTVKFGALDYPEVDKVGRAITTAETIIQQCSVCNDTAKGCDEQLQVSSLWTEIEFCGIMTVHS